MQDVLKQDVAEPNYFTMIFGLVFVIFLIYLTSFFYQKLIGVNSKISKKVLEIPDVNKIKMLSSTPLAQGQNLHLVQINGKTLLLGATSSSVNIVREFSEEEIKNYENEIQALNENKEGNK